jgi:hypothetical protein
MVHAQSSSASAVDAQAAPSWVEWSGGKCPVDQDAEVFVQLRFRRMEDGPARAHEYRWDHRDTDGDIIAYRVMAALGAVHGEHSGQARMNTESVLTQREAGE